MKQSLLTAGVLLTGLALFAGTLTVAGAALRQPVTDTVVTVKKEEETLAFPFPIKGTPLQAERLVIYEGPMLEEESDEPLVDVLALLVRNTGEQEVRSAQILLKTEDATHRFTATHIPAGSKALLIEKDQTSWSAYRYTACSGRAVLAAEEGLSAEQVEVKEVGLGELEFTNNTDKTLTELCVYHKNFLAGMDICVGGITYRTKLNDLTPGESVRVMMDHYASGYSKIVRVEGKEK